MPTSDAPPVTVHREIASRPTWDATHATSGGPANWPGAGELLHEAHGRRNGARLRRQVDREGEERTGDEAAHARQHETAAKRSAIGVESGARRTRRSRTRSSSRTREDEHALGPHAAMKQRSGYDVADGIARRPRPRHTPAAVADRSGLRVDRRKKADDATSTGTLYMANVSAVSQGPGAARVTRSLLTTRGVHESRHRHARTSARHGGRCP